MKKIFRWVPSFSKRSSPSLRKSTAGFTLMEIMVAAGLLGVISVIAVGVQKMGLQGQKTLLAADEARTLTNDMTEILKDGTACANTFGGRDPAAGVTSNSSTMDYVKDAAGNNVYSIGTRYGNRTVTFAEIRIGGSGTDSKANLPQNVLAGGGTSGQALVRINWQKTGETTGPTSLYRYFHVNYTLTGVGGTISTCTATGGTSSGGSDLWEQESGNPLNIYYSSGNVGIGTSTPGEQFHILGSDTSSQIKLTGSSGNSGYITGGVAANALFISGGTYFNGTSWIPETATAAIIPANANGIGLYANNTLTTGAGYSPTLRLYIPTSSGNVGIGTSTPSNKVHILETTSNSYGLRVEQTHATASQGLYVITQTTSSNDFGLRVSSNAGANENFTVRNNGNVGVGTSSPTQKLHVYSSTASISNMVESTTGGASFIANGPSGAAKAFDMWTSGSARWRVGADGTAESGSNAGSDFRLISYSDAGAQIDIPLFIDRASGNIGINNNTTPTYPLHILGNTTIEGALYTGVPANGSAGIEIGYDTTVNKISYIDFHADTTTADYAMRIQRAAGTDGGVAHINKGLGNFVLRQNDDAAIYLQTNFSSGTYNRFWANSSGVFAYTYNYASDRKLKKDIQPLEHGLERVLALKGVEFTWKQNGKQDIGFIGQEVQAVEPKLVTEDKSEKILTVQYSNITALLVEAVRELYQKIMGVDERVEKLEKENAELKARLDRMELMLKDLKK